MPAAILYRILVLTLALVSAASAVPAFAEPMTFVLLGARTLPCTNRDANVCFIQAEGEIDADTPERFRAFLAGLDIEAGALRGREMVLSSPGGDVDGAMALGRIIRETGLTTEIGKHRGPRRICRASPDYDGLLVVAGQQRDADLRETFAARPCIDVQESFEITSCLSACVFAFMGGEERTVFTTFPNFRVDELLMGDMTDIPFLRSAEQRQLGFHMIMPGLAVDYPPSFSKDVLVLGATWGQAGSVKVTRYLTEMGVSLDALDYFAKAQGEGNFFYPPYKALDAANVTGARTLDGPALRNISRNGQRGLAILWSRDDDLIWEKRIAIFCSKAAGSRGLTYIMLSGFYSTDPSAYVSAPVDPLTVDLKPRPHAAVVPEATMASTWTIQFPIKRDWFAASSHWDFWVDDATGERFRIRSDHSDKGVDTWRPTLPPTSRTIAFHHRRPITGTDAVFDHFIVGMPDAEFDAFLVGPSLKLHFRMNSIDAHVRFDPDPVMKGNIEAVRANCFTP